MKTFWRVLLLFVCASTVLWAQVDRGTITGVVTDPTGAVLPGVNVSVVESQTGVRYEGDTTSAQGVYHVLNLPVGRYILTFSKDGFKTYLRSGVTVSMSQNVTLDAKLEIGNRVDSVTVTGDAALLDTEDATLGSTVSGDELNNLPLTALGGRDARLFGRSIVATFSTVQGANQGYNNSIAGSQIASMSTSVDGTSSDAGIFGTVNAPGQDAISQFQVQTSGITAGAAQTGGGELMFELKSGTNSLHGSAYGFMANKQLNANTWDNKYFLSQCTVGDTACEASYARAPDSYNDWGFSAGGPIWKKHTFIFGAYEHYHILNLTAPAESATVPTAKMLGGDFSELLSAVTTNPLTGAACTAPCDSGQKDASGNPIYFGAIFNPLSPGNVFPGNIVPSTDISSESKKILQIYQQDYVPENGNLVNNYWGFSGFGSNPVDTSYHLDLKVDHTFSERNHASVSYNRYQETPIVPQGLWQHGTSDGGPLTFSYLQGTRSWQIRVQDYHTITANLVNFASVDYNYWLRWDSASHSVNDSALDFPTSSTGANNFPYTTFGGNNIAGESSIGSTDADHLPYYQGHYKDELSWVRGRHVFKFGGEFIPYGANSTEADGTLSYGFNSNTGESLGINNTPLASDVGFGFANFELGEVGSASKAVGGHLHGRRKGLNFYTEDTVKLTSKLTVDASLRWDFNTAWKEVNGQWSNFVLDAVNTSWTPLKGDYQYLSNGSQSFEKNQDWRLFSPHAGASYQISSKLVARGSWALSYVPLGINQWGGAPFAGEASFGYVGQDIMPAPATAVDAIYQWDGGSTYPGNYTAPTRNPNANIACPWCTISVDPDKLDLGHTNNWSMGVEYEITKNTVLDVNYMGNRGGHLHDGSDDPRNSPTWNSYQPMLTSTCTAASYSYTGSCAGMSVFTSADAAAAGVTWYPFMTTMTNNPTSYPATAPLLQYPQTFNSGIYFTDSAIGSSHYNALVTEVKRRASNGLSMDLSYTFSREAGNVNRGNGNFAENWGGSDVYQDPYSMDQMKNLISPNDVRHEVKGYVSYVLPFGNGHRWLPGKNSIVNQAVSGWTFATAVDYHAGQPMSAIRPSFWSYPNWSTAYVNVSTAPGALKNHFTHLDLNNLSDPSNQFFDPAAFSDLLDSSGNYLGTLGNSPPFFENWRGWAYYNEDLSILKKFSFHDGRYRATLRSEFFNVLNRHQWGGPNDWDYNCWEFGQVTSVSGNRTGQLGARFEW